LLPRFSPVRARRPGLIDQLKLAVFPATAATGLRVLDGESDRYELVDLARTCSGVVISTYRPLR
jgi:hypothetical protein